MGEHKTMIWWRILSGIAVVNLVLWLLLAVQTVGSSATPVGMLFGHLYGCAHFVLWPRIDLERFLVGPFVEHGSRQCNRILKSVLPLKSRS